MFEFFELINLDKNYNKLTRVQKDFCLYIAKQLIIKPQTLLKDVNVLKKVIATGLLSVRQNLKNKENTFISGQEAIKINLKNKYLDSIEIKYGFSYKYWAFLNFFMINLNDGFSIPIDHKNAKLLITDFLLKNISQLPKDKTSKELYNKAPNFIKND